MKEHDINVHLPATLTAGGEARTESNDSIQLQHQFCSSIM